MQLTVPAILLTLTLNMQGIAQGPVVFEGPVFSQSFGTNRTVRIYLPPSYERDPSRRFPVLYLHDGQNAFTTVGTNVAFGWGNWELDRTVTGLCAAGRMREIIMVAVDCSAERYLDYRGPACRYTESELKDMKRLPPAPADNSRYEKYTRFLIGELKPKIDREYRTLAGPESTGVLGSSMGGICSLALAWEHPEVFGKAASLSGSFQIERTNFLANVLGSYRGKAKPTRIYLDSGVCDFSGGDDGRRNTDAVARELRRMGWKDEVDLLHYTDLKPLPEPELERAGLRRDKWKEAQTSQHNEFYWRLRAWRPLVYLFPPE
ncbi:MAG TPA: alpha/beta hydrolase-fold protein [Candidatus Angelobacter sp.]|nr:alpha/beta hydrolase-fold protein [Candidatus Angelobacter sp.]